MPLKPKDTDPAVVMENEYCLPYHWMKEYRLRRANRLEKQRIIFGFLNTLQYNNPIKYLDAGCGDGRWTSDISDRLPEGSSSFGADTSERAIGFAKLIRPEISWTVYRDRKLPYESSSFDLITAIEVLEHIPRSEEMHFIHEIVRVLKPDGYLILTTPSIHAPLPEKHFQHYDHEYLRELLVSSGLEVLSIAGFMRKCTGWKRKLIDILNEFPMLWKIGKWYHREEHLDVACDILVLARNGRS
jgi:SAM-dependent methyltransferase